MTILSINSVGEVSTRQLQPMIFILTRPLRRMVTTTRSTMLDLATSLYNEGVIVEMALESDSASMDADKIAELKEMVNDRYEKAQTVTDMILEKLPVHAAPLGTIGTQLINVYNRLADATGDEKNREMAKKLALDEIDLYKQYVLYFQQLTPEQLSTLPLTDRYIYDTYFISLLQSYAEAGGDVQELMKKLQGEGVNFTRYFGNQKQQ